MAAYDIRKKKGYCSLHKSREEVLVLNNDPNDKHWRDYFVFVDKDSLGEMGS